jgi:hypothetical protein
MGKIQAIYISLVFLSTHIICLGQTEVSIACRIAENIMQTKELRYYILSGLDTIFQSKAIDPKSRRALYDSLGIYAAGTYRLKFEHFDGSGVKQVEYDFIIDGKERLVQIFLYYTMNSLKNEYLKDVTVSKFYTPTNVKLIATWDKKVGSRPVYKVLSNSDTAFYGVSVTSHFYGKILFRKQDSWMVNSGSYCGTTLEERPLSKGTWVYSYVPAFSTSKEYRVTEKGEYRYVVTLGLQKYSTEFPRELARSATTRKRTLIFFEIEDRFFVM